ncbi:hypothetical protein [Microbulbifer sp. JSM ZJ756]|uniref:hypothetical protein n=1 Tax=Microbulbifer sp. JSM ZJ756 TaxID=3376191 RepID=UPI0037B9DA93
MGKYRICFVAGSALVLVLAAILFKPQISTAIENQYVLWHLDRLDAERYHVTTLPTVFHVMVNKGRHRFVFYYRGVSDISRQVSAANEFLSGWPGNRSRCENRDLPGQEACLIAGSTAVLEH